MPATRSLRRREALTFYLTISPWLIGFLFLTVGPMLYSLYISFTRWDLLRDPVFIGLGNYLDKMPNDDRFWQSLKVTLIYTLAYVPLELIGGLGLAMLIRNNIPGVRIFRTIFYLPTVLAGVAFVVVWLWMLNPRGGLVNLALDLVGINGPRWLLDPDWALFALVLMSFWGWGRAMVIYLAGLQSIPAELYEAAAIDGSSGAQTFFRVTLPLLSPTIFFNLILSIIGTFQTFTNAFVATNGGPLDSTLFFVLYLYKRAFEFLDMGYAAALAWVLFAIILVLTLIVFRSQRFWVFYAGERADE
ncbi:ABC transporter permease subunit [bacterium]|nr:ABC transporter permease subunit [bacterium]